MQLSIITVTYNAADRIAEQLRSVIFGCGDMIFEQIIVDNGSSDGTLDLIRKEFPTVWVIPNGKNRGFGKANNQGVELATAPLILFLNPDMRIREAGSLRILMQWMDEHPNVGIAGGKLVRPDGSFNPDAAPRRFPKLREMIFLLLKIPHFFPSLMDRYLVRDFDPEQEQAVDSVRGSFMLVRREILQNLGHAFDPRYFFWFEDVDLCREAKRLGWKVMYTPIISCIDYVGQSFKRKSFWWKQKRFAASAAKYFWKWKH